MARNLTPTARLVVHVDADLADHLARAVTGFIDWRQRRGETVPDELIDLGWELIATRDRLTTCQTGDTGAGPHEDRGVWFGQEAAAVSITDAAARAGISRSTLYRLAAAGRGPRTIRVGRRRLVPVADLDRWVAGQ